MKLFVFLVQRAQDRAPWPCVYTDKALAEKAIGRISVVAELELEREDDQTNRHHYSEEPSAGNQ